MFSGAQVEHVRLHSCQAGERLGVAVQTALQLDDQPVRHLYVYRWVAATATVIVKTVIIYGMRSGAGQELMRSPKTCSTKLTAADLAAAGAVVTVRRAAI
eukprot:SAG22_NODE_3402_length_1733_cov_1.705630_2_plen_100_part_00